MKREIILMVIVLLIFPVISADVIMPGMRPIEINNYITNINNFPDYVFVSGVSLDNFGPGISSCPLRIIDNNGKISQQYYKACPLSVYAIPKEKFNVNETEKFLETESGYTSKEVFVKYLDSIGAKEVIKNIDTYSEVPESSSITEETNYYTIDLKKVKIEPDIKETDKNIWKEIWYLLLSLIALIIIIIILARGQK